MGAVELFFERIWKANALFWNPLEQKYKPMRPFRQLNLIVFFVTFQVMSSSL